MGCCDTPEPLNTTIPRCAGPPGRRSLNTRGIALSRAFRAATAHRPRIGHASALTHLMHGDADAVMPVREVIDALA